MPRRPTGNNKGSSRPPLLPFSSFGRSLARLASGSSSKLDIEVLPKSSEEIGFEEQSVKEKVGPSKKRLKEKVEQQSESEVSSDEGMVQADFAFFDPKPDDFHGVKILLQTYLDDKEWDLSGFVDLILAQTTVGTVVKIEDTEDDVPFSILTALNLGRYKDHNCIREIKEYLLTVCKENDVRGKLKMILGDQAHNVGLLVCQRVVNLPPQLLPPLYDALFDEVSWATEDEPTEELQKSFRFKYYIVATKFYKHKATNQHKGTLKKGNDEPIIYVKAEDEIFHKLSLWSCSFPLHTQQLATEELRNYKLTGLVMAVEASKVPMFRKELHSLTNDS